MLKVAFWLSLVCALIQAQPTPFPTAPTTAKPTTLTPTATPTLNPTYDANAKIYLYGLSTWPLTGDIGTRASIDFSCQSEAILKNIFCQRHAGFLSFSATDQLKDVAENHLQCSSVNLPVVGPTNLPVVDNWNALFSYPLANSLTSALVLENPDMLENAFFSGSFSDGTFAGSEKSCESWTTAAPLSGAGIGNADATDASYLDYIDGSCDGEAASAILTKSRIICACFYNGARRQ